MLLYPIGKKRKRVGEYHPQRAIVILAAFFLIVATTVIPLAPVFAQSLDAMATTSTDQSTTPISDQASSSDVASSMSIIASTSTSSDQNRTSSLDVASDMSVTAPTSTSSSSVSDNSASSFESLNADSSIVSSSLTTGTVMPENHSQKATKFKKDNSLSEDAQLAAVRQHLIDAGLPQEIIDRIDAYKTAEQQGPQQPGPLTKITDFLTGNTDAQKDQAKAEVLAKKQPFKVDTFNGSIRTASKDSYNQTFSNKQEQSGGLLQKVINFFNTGTLKNLNFDNTKTTTPLSWLFGQKAVAASDNPSDYLAAGNEITFSQAIKDRADALNHDPLTILNFVRNNMTYVPYYGSKKGADATLVEQAGNDTDKASLLIAMLRYSGIPARYRQVDAKMDIGTVTDLLGVHSATAAAQVLSLEQIPYTLYTDNESNPLFFVIEHTYVEAYIPYGYSRGVNMNDGGGSQWVPMDPSINTYQYAQTIDTMGGMDTAGFQIEQFFDNYLNAGSSTLEPLDAFKNQVQTYLATSYPQFTYDDVLTHSYPGNKNLDFIPGTLPYGVAADLDTYAYVPTSLRHTIAFTVKDDQENTVLSYMGYVSDLADKELLMTYAPASQADQDTLNTFDTIYDVVPLSLVAVKPSITVNGTAVVTGSASTMLGQAQSYTMEFNAPTRTIGGSISSNAVETVNRDVITGNTDAIALDTDRVVPSGLRPSQDTQTTSFVANQELYETGVDFLDRLQNTQGELASITGSDFTNTASRATIFNGIDVTYASSGAPYSFSWKGLRIDSSSKVNYFNRFNNDTTTHFKEFTAVFGLQASQEESDIFQDNFNVDSIATVKGLKLVSAGTFPGITLHKITSANESDIDSLSLSTSTKSIFHTAVEAGKTVYTPSAEFTYNNWTGLVYITIDFNGGVAGYIIGEGLNGGYTTAPFANGLQDFFINASDMFSSLTATIVSPINSQNFTQGDPVQLVIDYTGILNATSVSWTESSTLSTFNYSPGTYTLRSLHGTTSTVNITVTKVVLGNPDNKAAILPFDGGLDDLFASSSYISTTSPQFSIPADLLKAVAAKESGAHFNFESYRYEPCLDANTIRQDTLHHYSSYYPWANYWISNLGADGSMMGGAQINAVKDSSGKRPWEFSDPLNFQYPLKLVDLNGDGKITVYEIWKENDPIQNYSSYCTLTEAQANFSPQLLIAASYGPGQELYTTAVNNNNFDQTTGVPPNPGQTSVDIGRLFIPQLAIPDMVNNLKSLYNNNLSLQEGCATGLRTWTVLEQYNGSGQRAIDYANTVCTWWSVDKLFAPHIFDSTTRSYISYTP